MVIEADAAVILAGVRRGKTLGSPVAIQVENLDHSNWSDVMAVGDGGPPPELLTVPRPGHADLAGCIKYRTKDIRNILERASARETTARVCAGTTARELLREFGIAVISHVTGIGSLDAVSTLSPGPGDLEVIDESPLRCLDGSAVAQMQSLIDRAREAGDSLGGRFEVLAFGVPPGLGSHVHWDRRLDGELARTVMSIPAIKSVAIGEGEKLSYAFGSEAHDAIRRDESGLGRDTNRAGGVEGGISNGMVIVVRAAMKPIPTLARGLPSVDMANGSNAMPAKERADVCAVPAAAVVAESCVAWALACALQEKLGGDSLEEMHTRFHEMREHREHFLQ
jgi:chorismate synthase